MSHIIIVHNYLAIPTNLIHSYYHVVNKYTHLKIPINQNFNKSIIKLKNGGEDDQ